MPEPGAEVTRVRAYVVPSLPVNIERDQGCWRHGFVRRDPYQYDSIFKDDPGDYMGL